MRPFEPDLANLECSESIEEDSQKAFSLAEINETGKRKRKTEREL